jgi:hypothetical protein
MSKVLVISKQHPFDSIGRMDVNKGGGATFNVSKHFLEYLTSLSEKEKDEVMKQVVEQQLEKLAMQANKNHAFHGDEGGFEQYCKLKYKLLHDHILQMIDGLTD